MHNSNCIRRRHTPLPRLRLRVRCRVRSNIWLMPTKPLQLLAAAGILLIMGLPNIIQMYALGAVALLALYNGQRGKCNIKWLFYWYYPIHLGILHLIAML